MARSRRAFSSKLQEIEIKQMRSSVEKLAASACRRYWWFTAVYEIAIGAWAFALGLITLFCATPDNLSIIGWILALLLTVGALIAPTFLNVNYVIPSGLLLRIPQRDKVSRLLVAISTGVYVVLGIYGAAFLRTNYLVIGAALALIMLFLYARWGQTRHFGLGAWLFCVCMMSPAIASLFSVTNLRVVAIALLLCGLGVLITNVRTFVSASMALVQEGIEDNGHILHMMKGWYTAEELTTAMTSRDTGTRLLAALFLRDYIEPKMLTAIIDRTRDENQAVALAAQSALSSIWGPDPDEVVEWQMRRVVRRSKHDAHDKRIAIMSVEEIERLAHERFVIEKDMQAHEREVEQVLKTQVAHDEAALQKLIELAKDEKLLDQETRLVATELLGATCDHRAYATLVQLMLSGERALVDAASEGFKGASASAVVHIEPLFADAREWVRIAAMNAGIGLLGTLEMTDAREALIARTMLHDTAFSLATHRKPVTRAIALGLLAQFGEEAVSLIEASCHDRFAMVRGEGIRALSIVDAKCAASYVTEALQDSRAYVRSTAISCVAYLRLAEARPRLEEMRNDCNSVVAALAEHCLVISQSW